MKKFLLVAIAALSIGGCSSSSSRSRPNGPFSFHTTPGATQVRSVAVLPFTLGAKVGRSAGAIDASMSAALRELGYSQVINVAPDKGKELVETDVIYEDNITTKQLLRLRQELKVEAVLIGRVDQFDGFDPLAMGMTATMISCLDGTVLWSVTGHFDAHNLDVQQDIRRWYDGNRSGDQTSVGGWKLALQSPSMFTRYVCDRVVASLPYRAN